MRDNFKAKTKRTLAARVGHHCSNPDCVCSTSGPALDDDAEVSIGVAAHIAAAEKGGKRYDDKMTPAERASGHNGIWLCQSCSKLIDSDENRYTVELLHQWKKDAVKKAQESIAGGRALGKVVPDPELDEADTEFLRGLDLPTVDAVDAVAIRLRAAAEVDIGHFRAEHGRPRRTVVLTLRLRSSAAPVTIDGIARLVQLAEPISLPAPGGTGKSTTLLQFAEQLLAIDGPVPIIVPLGAWATREEDFFAAALRRPPFGAFRRQHFMQLAYHGRLVLLLDGWNELSTDARLRATHDLADLQRDYPQLGIIVTTRRHALPVVGPVVEIEALSQDQQLELARGLRGEEGVALVDRAARTSGVRDLVRIPLYLNALLALPPGAAFPETKEAVLRMFVEQNAASPARAAQLQRDTLGHHDALLVGLAVSATGNANTSISDANANRAVTGVVQALAQDGQIQIGNVPQPRDMIDGLVSAHLLVREQGADAAVRFQHPLFQEWFAAAEVERLMIRSAAGNADARRHLREQIFNWLSWEESILFACDRLSRSGDDGVEAVAEAVMHALGIDPLLAASMINRASDAVWTRLRECVVRFIRRWHQPGTFDRAVRFMVATGKPEFADLVWPLAGNPDEQIQFETFRGSNPFHPSVLGADREARLSALGVPQRKLALSEIASNSGFDGMELAARLASNDSEPGVVVSVVESLAFRRGDRHVNQIMRHAPDGVWAALAQAGYPESLTDPELDARLAREREAIREAETDLVKLLNHLIEDRPADAPARISSLIAEAADDFRERYLEYAIARAYEIYPEAVATGIIARIEAARPLPYRARDFLSGAHLIDAGPTADAALNPATPERRLVEMAAVLGPVTVDALFEQLFAVNRQIREHGRYDEALSNAHNRLVRALCAARQDVFMPALLAKAQTTDERQIGELADLFARYGEDNSHNKIPIGARYVADMRSALESWIATLVRAPRLARGVSSQVARATERLADPALAAPLRTLLDRDLIVLAEAMAARLAARGQGQYDTIGYNLIYARAFAALDDARCIDILTRDLGHPEWGLSAASALYQIWTKRQPPEHTRPFGGWNDYSSHLAQRAERTAGAPRTSDFADSIFSVVRAMGRADRAEADQRHAIALAAAGLAMPHGSKRAEIDALLELPQPAAQKHKLLVAAARAGEIVPVEVLLEGLRDLLALAETETWRLDENRGELMGWIELFPFSSSPDRIHEAIALLPEPHRRPHALRRLLESLPHSPPEAALEMLNRLASDNPTFLGEYAWANALMAIPSEAAGLALLEYLCSGRLGPGDGLRMSQVLTARAKKYPAVRASMIARYAALADGPARRALEMTMYEMPDEEIFMALFGSHADMASPMHGVNRAIWNLAVGRKTVDDAQGAFEEFGIPLTQLREWLFAMLQANDSRAVLAKKCLIAIDEARDECGRIYDEPRHPDIATNLPWPPEVDEPAGPPAT